MDVQKPGPTEDRKMPDVQTQGPEKEPKLMDVKTEFIKVKMEVEEDTPGGGEECFADFKFAYGDIDIKFNPELNDSKEGIFFPGFTLDTKAINTSGSETTQESEGNAASTSESSENDSCAKALSLLADIAANDLKNSRKRRRRRRPRAEYEQIIEGLLSRVQTMKMGFTEDELKLIWKVVSHPICTKLPCGVLRRIIHVMVPETKVTCRFLRSIVQWLHDAVKKGFKPTVVAAVYQLLDFYMQNACLDDKSVPYESVITQLLVAKTHNMVIPWKMRLIKRLSTPLTLDIIHILELNKLQIIPGLKKTQHYDIVGSIAVCKIQRPDLFYNGDAVRRKDRKLRPPQNVVEIFNQHQERFFSECIAEPHPMADRIFPEFLPVVGTKGKFLEVHEKKRLEEIEIVESLGTDTGICSVALTPSLMKKFEKWLGRVLSERFQFFSGFDEASDFERYDFIFKVCMKITEIRNKPIPTLDKWVTDFICKWDIWHFRRFVENIVPFVDPKNILPKKEGLQSNLLQQFIYYPSGRPFLWTMLDRLYGKWIKALNKGGGTRYRDDVTECLKWLLTLMTNCVNSIIFAAPFDKFHNPLLIRRICLFYHEVETHHKEMPLRNDLKECMRSFPISLPGVVMEMGDEGCLELLIKIALIRASWKEPDYEVAYAVDEIISYSEFGAQSLPDYLTEIPDSVKPTNATMGKKIRDDIVFKWLKATAEIVGFEVNNQ